MKKAVWLAGVFSMLTMTGAVYASDAPQAGAPQKAVAAATDESGFPLRDKFYKVKVISTDDLYKNFDKYTIIDVRSPFEHKVMRIEGAYSVPVGDKLFVDKVSKIWKDNGEKPIVFYCYGHKCARSYDASTKMTDVNKDFPAITYDGGITDWSTLKREKTSLFGKSFDASKVIANDEFKKHLLRPDAFTSSVSKNPDIVIIDIRDRYEVQAFSFFPGRDYPVGFDFDKLKKIIESNRDANKTVYFYDEAGYRVKSLQYLIKEIGLENYAFLDGGVVEYFKSINTFKKK